MPTLAEACAIYAAVDSHIPRRYGWRSTGDPLRDFSIFDIYRGTSTAIVEAGAWTPHGQDVSAVMRALRG